MIVDSSAIIAIVSNEPDADALASKLNAAKGELAISAGNYLESAVVLDNPRFAGIALRLNEIIDEMEIEIAPVTAQQAKLGRQFYRQYGKGSGHPAKLNFGDCFAYALAIERDEPLLFKGEDFLHTDVRRV